MRQKIGGYGKTSGIIFKDGESMWWKLRHEKMLGNRNKYGSKYVAGVIGEEEGRKWLTEQGYGVYEFGGIDSYFHRLEKTIDRLKRRSIRYFAN